MGQLIDLSQRRRARRRRPRRVRGTLYVDLSDPSSVFALDAVDRAWPTIRVRLACREAMGLLPIDGPEEAHARAASLRVRLELPDPLPGHLTPAVRVGSRAIGSGRGRDFVLAAARLAYHGGYDLSAPDVLAEASGVAGLGWEATLEAMHEPRWAGFVQDTSRLLRRRGATQLPVLQIGAEMVCGDEPVRARLATLRYTGSV